jgi:predicted amidophosphoribosyltransferase
MDLTLLFAPERCVSCRRRGPLVCDGCRCELRRIDGARCSRCGCPTLQHVPDCRECHGRRLGFHSAAAAVELDRRAAGIVRWWKDRGLGALAEAAAAVVSDVVARPSADVLIPVPSDRDRARWRGVDPPAALARALGARWGMEVAEVLRRTGRRPQRGLDRRARRRNAQSAFAAVAACPRRVVLVDDVYTTGATADACARILRGAGAERIDVVTFARTAAFPGVGEGWGAIG